MSTMNTSPEFKLLCDRGTSDTLMNFFPFKWSNLGLYVPLGQRKYFDIINTSTELQYELSHHSPLTTHHSHRIFLRLDVVKACIVSAFEDANALREVAQEPLRLVALHFSVLHWCPTCLVLISISSFSFFYLLFFFSFSFSFSLLFWWWERIG